jgi:transmembrane sensor
MPRLIVEAAFLQNFLFFGKNSKKNQPRAECFAGPPSIYLETFNKMQENETNQSQTTHQALLQKYLDNTCSASELEQALDLLGSPGGLELLENLTTPLETPQLFAESKMAGSASERTWSRLEASLQSPAKSGLRPIWSSGRRTWLSAAAVAALLMLAGWWYLQVPARAAFTEVTTNYGEQKRLNLADGSSIVLNSNSKLSYRVRGKGVREAYIDGEAFFSIKHLKNDRPFHVHTADGCTVEVLGTEFNVKRRSAGTNVVLQSGSIRLSTQTAGKTVRKMLKPGQLAEISAKSQDIEVKEVEAEKISDWRNGVIHFESTTSLREIKTLMKEHFGLDLEVDSEFLWGKELDGSLSIKSSKEFIESISIALDMKAERKGNSVVFSKSN